MPPEPDPTLATPAYDLTVTGARESKISASRASQPPQALPPFLSSDDPGVELTLPGGSQPSQPLTLSFNLQGKVAPLLATTLYSPWLRSPKDRQIRKCCVRHGILRPRL